ncbi:MAG TPA: prolipoprotein diacylglyceryl transferase family protein [Candidatus Bathyarchaeia archaeon]|nr:prolipoprotein diacylglyceryl transferase family protein [Candidatus Bathyarchaeia archaeon]
MPRNEKYAFRLCGYTGFLLSFVQSLVLVRHLGLSQLTLLGITGTVILTFYVLMMITKILASGEVIIYYHHEIAVIATSALFLRLTGQPVLPYLDVLVLGLGVFLACGRIGCLIVGCCHGRPCRWGVRYGSAHADAGFPRDLVGVRLFPIQAVESALALCIVSAGWLLLLARHAPGSVLVGYVIAYGCGRFCLEFFRGDAGRPYLWDFSEAQWTSGILAVAVSIGASVRILPASKWHWIVPACLGIAMVVLTAWRRLDPSRRFELFHPHHLREVVGALDHLDHRLFDARFSREPDGSLTVHVAQTSRGYRLSIGETRGASGLIRHYSLSKKDGALSLGAARILARLITSLQRRSFSFRLVEGRAGVFHVLLNTRSDSPQEVLRRAILNKKPA